MTTQEEISEWFDEGRKEKDITHMLVICDTFDYEDYPVYVSKTEDVRKVYKEYNGQNMQRVMEVYCYKLPIKKQLEEKRAFNF